MVVGKGRLDLPVFTHAAKDMKSFRMFTSHLCVEGKVKQANLVRVFGVSAISNNRCASSCPCAHLASPL